MFSKTLVLTFFEPTLNIHFLWIKLKFLTNLFDSTHEQFEPTAVARRGPTLWDVVAAENALEKAQNIKIGFKDKTMYVNKDKRFFFYFNF